MKEYQVVFKEMNARMTQLEAKNNQLERELKRVMLQSQNRSEADVKKLLKRIGTLENTCRAEFKKVEQIGKIAASDVI